MLQRGRGACPSPGPGGSRLRDERGVRGLLRGGVRPPGRPAVPGHRQPPGRRGRRPGGADPSRGPLVAAAPLQRPRGVGTPGGHEPGQRQLPPGPPAAGRRGPAPGRPRVAAAGAGRAVGPDRGLGGAADGPAQGRGPPPPARPPGRPGRRRAGRARGDGQVAAGPGPRRTGDAPGPGGRGRQAFAIRGVEATMDDLRDRLAELAERAARQARGPGAAATLRPGPDPAPVGGRGPGGAVPAAGGWARIPDVAAAGRPGQPSPDHDPTAGRDAPTGAAAVDRRGGRPPARRAVGARTGSRR